MLLVIAVAAIQEPLMGIRLPASRSARRKAAEAWARCASTGKGSSVRAAERAHLCVNTIDNHGCSHKEDLLVVTIAYGSAHPSTRYAPPAACPRTWRPVT